MDSQKLNIVPLDLVFKGDRHYIQGASFYEKISEYLLKVLPERMECSFQMVIHNFGQNQCLFAYTLNSEKLKKPERGLVEISTSTGIHGWVIESQNPISKRVHYTEDEITNNCQIRDRLVEMKKEVPFHPIEVLVSITKYIHQLEYPDSNKKWIFTRLELDRILKKKDISKMGVKIKNNIGTRITQSDIFSEDISIGKIYFSLVSTWPR